MIYERTEMSGSEERAFERFWERWNDAVESLESDIENLADYAQRIATRNHDVHTQIDEARGYMKALGESLDALERLANA